MIPIVCCLACGHAHPAKAWVDTPKDAQHAAVGICERCHDIALPLRGGCNDRGCLCIDGNTGAAVTKNVAPHVITREMVNIAAGLLSCIDIVPASHHPERMVPAAERALLAALPDWSIE